MVNAFSVNLGGRSANTNGCCIPVRLAPMEGHKLPSTHRINSAVPVRPAASAMTYCHQMIVLAEIRGVFSFDDDAVAADSSCGGSTMEIVAWASLKGRPRRA